MIKNSFQNDNSFLTTLDKACRIVVNENSVNNKSSKSSELLAKFCDVLLKKGKNLELTELDDKLNQLVKKNKWF
jgi:hypothetical protein